MRSKGPKTMDPVKGSTVYENRCVTQVMETLVQYKYLKRPFELEPLLLTAMPDVVETPPDVLKAAQENLAGARRIQQEEHKVISC